jgi:hypothetical protein
MKDLIADFLHDMGELVEKQAVAKGLDLTDSEILELLKQKLDRFVAKTNKYMKQEQKQEQEQ